MSRVPLAGLVEDPDEGIVVVEDTLAEPEQRGVLSRTEVEIDSALKRPVEHSRNLPDILLKPLLKVEQRVIRRRALSGSDRIRSGDRPSKPVADSCLIFNLKPPDAAVVEVDVGRVGPAAESRRLNLNAPSGNVIENVFIICGDGQNIAAADLIPQSQLVGDRGLGVQVWITYRLEGRACRGRRKL